MLKGIDISNWQAGLDIQTNKPGFVIVKATEGTSYVDKTCDGFVQTCIKNAIPFGFYHFARNGAAVTEATAFRNNTNGYEGLGIPVLDLEVNNGNDWLETWCRTYWKLTGVYPWVYLSSDYVNNKGYGTDWVREHCGLWLAGYPKRYTTYPADTKCPYNHSGWTLAAWQFTDKLTYGGMSVDGDVFYGDESAWKAYAGASANASGGSMSGSGSFGGASVSTSGDTLGPTDLWKLARRVVNGEFGAGESRKAALGSTYETVQGMVTLLMNGSDNALAQVVLTGAMGDGSTRKYILGGRYTAVQARVNVLMRRR